MILHPPVLHSSLDFPTIFLAFNPSMALQAASVICLSFFSASEFSSLLLLPCRLITIIVDDMVIKTMVAISSINVIPFYYSYLPL